jgi:hypothetical protein
VTTLRAFAIVALGGALSACTVRIAEFTIVGTAPEPPPATVAPAERVTGRSCRGWVLGLTLGLPRMEDALTDALARAGSAWLRDVTLDSVHPVYGPIGRHCYVVTGLPWRAEAR